MHCLIPRFVLLVALAAGCAPEVDREPPHMVVVLVDQLRKDVADRSMPRTRALAERGVIFDNARSAAPWTYPSVVSMFSGLYPQEHGATDSDDGTELTYFSRDVPLVQRILTSAGYHAAGFVANPFLGTWNPFHEDFSHYDVSFVNDHGNWRDGGTKAHREQRKGQTAWTDRMWGDNLNRAVREHYDERALAEPELTYVHYIDVHGRRQGQARWETAPFDGDLSSACEFVDDCIVELYDYFAERYAGSMIFLVTSDHGEAHGDDEEIGYGKQFRRKKRTVHDFNLRIPLWVLESQHLPAARTVDEAVSNIDIASTLLDLAGLPQPAPMRGRSLVPTFEGHSTGPARPLYARSDGFRVENDCVVWENNKLLRHFDLGTHEIVGQRIFDLEHDPRETISSEANPDLNATLETLVGQEARGAGIFPSSYTKPDGSTLEALKAIGYGGGDGD
ncbi:MAG: arylsulfatase A-like enzyme [Chlamydiales bacterium]|jgi:arylsulfatase A-like enzyme